jgi:hypothetical protein
MLINSGSNQILLINGVDWALYFEPRRPQRPKRKNMVAHLAAVQLDRVMDDECILVENKTVNEIHPVHRAQLLTYLKLSGRSIGFLINWRVTRIKDGIQHMIR